DADALESPILLGSHVEGELALPRLPRRERGQRRADGDLNLLDGLVLPRPGLGDLVLAQAPSAAVWYERGEIPLALEGDPPALRVVRRDLRQVLTRDGPAGEPNRANRMLALKLLGLLLGPFHGRHPRHDEIGALRHVVAILDRDVLLDQVPVGA